MTTSSKKKTSSKTSGKSVEKVDSVKRTPARKKARKKKKNVLNRGALFAFLAGLLLASAAFWFLRAMPEHTAPQQQGLQEERTEKAKAAGQAVQETKGNAADWSGQRQASPPAPSAPSGGHARTKAVPQLQGVAPVPRALPELPGPANSGGNAGRGDKREAVRNSAVASALIDLQSLPYEETLSLSLDERIRQVDYALMQTAWFRKLPAKALRLVLVEDRLEGVEPYQYQTIDILPGGTPGPFLDSLRDCLQAWAEGAVLQEAEGGENIWTISVNGVETHRLRLHPSKEDLPLLPDESGLPAPPPPSSASASPAEAGVFFPRARSRPRKAGEEAKLVIVMDDLGANRTAVHKLLALNFPVTFAFWPHGAHTREGAMAAHAKGREILVHLPMEPIGYPEVKPGPNVLLTRMSAAEIRRITEAGIAAVPHASGLNNHMGSRFTQNTRGVEAVLDVLKERGLFLLDSLTHNRSVFGAEAERLGIEHYQRNVFLDVEPSRSKVVQALQEAEAIALLTGQAIAIGHPLPETLAALRDWQGTRNKDVRLVRLRDLND